MEPINKVYNIVQDAGMSRRPEYYSGRGAITCDLNEKQLFKIHEAIVKEFGEDAGKAFVKMVAGIKVLSATTFLQELYGLCYQDWKYQEHEDAPGISVPKDDKGNYNVEMGIFGMIAAMGNTRDETRQIRDHFLRCRGHKVKHDVEHMDNDGTIYYTDGQGRRMMRRGNR